ncbi:MAG TPA: hypothetical protein VKI41_14965 [Vicinamibacteria bacterium]|nr:hypothetical protein [Vicinamibacteria bacterium]
MRPPFRGDDRTRKSELRVVLPAGLAVFDPGAPGEAWAGRIAA